MWMLKSPVFARVFATVPALRAPTAAFVEHSWRTAYCCLVSGPDWNRRGRLCSRAPAAIPASCRPSVSPWLYRFEAAPKRARQRSCRGVRGSRGRDQSRRNCFPFRRYQTHSPQRPLRRVGLRHFPEGAQNWQQGQRRPCDTLGIVPAFRLWESFGLPVCIIRAATLVSAARQPGQPVARPRALWSPAWRLGCGYALRQAPFEGRFTRTTQPAGSHRWPLL